MARLTIDPDDMLKLLAGVPAGQRSFIAVGIDSASDASPEQVEQFIELAAAEANMATALRRDADERTVAGLRSNLARARDAVGAGRATSTVEVVIRPGEVREFVVPAAWAPHVQQVDMDAAHHGASTIELLRGMQRFLDAGHDSVAAVRLAKALGTPPRNLAIVAQRLADEAN